MRAFVVSGHTTTQGPVIENREDMEVWAKARYTTTFRSVAVLTRSVLRLRPLDSIGDVSSFETVEKIIRP